MGLTAAAVRDAGLVVETKWSSGWGCAAGAAFLALWCGLVLLAGSLAWDGAGLCLGNDGHGLPREDPTPCHVAALAAGRFGPDLGGSWYFWQLPAAGTWAAVFPWLCYTAHVVSLWAIQWRAQRALYRAGLAAGEPEAHAGSGVSAYSPSLRRFNVHMLVANAFFHLLHLAQTQWTYDALAPHVSVWSSQASVIMVLLVGVALDLRTRGFLLGVATPRLQPGWVLEHVKRHHGYYINWAAVYTFWYHPCEPLLGFLLGFCNTGVFMLQGSLMFTTTHRSPVTRAVVLGWVALHGAVIALQTAPGWPMFLTGFLLWVFTTILPGYILRERQLWVRLACAAVGLAICVAVVALAVVPESPNGWAELNAIIRIPAILWFCPLAYSALFAAGVKAEQRLQRPAVRRGLACLVLLALVVLVHALPIVDRLAYGGRSSPLMVPTYAAIALAAAISPMALHMLAFPRPLPAAAAKLAGELEAAHPASVAPQ